MQAQNTTNTAGQGLVALVTGANKGIGLEIAKALDAHGYIVYIGSRNLAHGQQAAAALSTHARVVQLDITDIPSIRAAVDQIQNDYGQLDLLVNNAAISQAHDRGLTVEEIMALQMPDTVSIDDMRTVWDTNVFGTLAVTQAFLPLLKNAKGPRIVNISSGLGSLTIAMRADNPYRGLFDTVYAASKTALNGVSVSMAIAFEKYNIRVAAVSPGYTATALNNFQGTDTLAEGSKEPIRVCLDTDFKSGMFTGPTGVYPW